MRWLLMAGAGRTICLDATTGLERRQVGILNRPGDRRFNIVIDFDNYRDVEGVKFVHDINEERTSQEPVQSFVTYTEPIELNVPMDDSLFAPPAVKIASAVPPDCSAIGRGVGRWCRRCAFVHNVWSF